MNWLRWRKKRRPSPRSTALTVAAPVVLLALLSGTAPEWGLSLLGFGAPARPSLVEYRSPAQDVPRRRAVELPVPAVDSDEAVLGRPLALAFDADRLYIADALDCAVKIFSKDGRFIRSFGEKGQGPGQLSFPSGVCVAGDAVAVADKLNLRIQLFDVRGGARGGFKLGFAPDRVIFIGEGRLAVTANPTGRKSGERLVHVFDLDGTPVWSGVEAKTTSDAVSDAFRNMILICPAETSGFYLIFRSGDRSIRRYAASGALAGAVPVDGRFVSKSVTVPTAGGPLKLAGFCWAAAADGGFLYLSAPELLDGRDLGPGRSIFVLDAEGRPRSIIDLPCPVHRFAVAGGRLFAIDEEGGLRIFEVGR